MTTAAAPVAQLDDQLAADFYLYESLLPDEERKMLLKARTFMRDEAKPLVNDAWSKAELPQELIGTHQMQTLIVGKSITGHSAFVG
ncbi:hypothetical protein ACGFZQ_42280 [Streptomyces sp. NPDC048254]|uniref:hypothetical protein n=1 Tax=Streptomyces sp. NPDC048254 TaxID=3365525 RepID=UPI0037126FBA